MKRIVCMLLAACLLLAFAGCKSEKTDPAQTSDPTEATAPGNTMTGEALMKELKIGWNLGNTFDAPEGELSWGNPVTTKEMLQKVKELGFNTIRIPISWHKHVSDGPEYTIKESWLTRVENVVNDALDVGLYVIINSHHDNDQYMPTPANSAAAKTYLSAIWSQVAERFKDTDYHLIFQTMNEPRVTGKSYEWSIDTRNAECMEAVGVVNDLNQVALDAIRATGGKNADRFVIVSPYAGAPLSAQVDQFKLPTDSAEGKLIVSVHAYTPYNLCLNVNSPESQFKQGYASEINSFMRNLNYKYVQKGIPVIIDEMGCINKDNPEARYEWAKTYISKAKEYGMVCCWWDNGIVTGGGERFGLLDRRKLEVAEQSQSVYEGLMEGLTVSAGEE